MDGVAISIIGRPRPLPGHDTANPAHNTYTLKCEEPFWCVVSSVKGVATTPRIWLAVLVRGGGTLKSDSEGVIR